MPHLATFMAFSTFELAFITGTPTTTTLTRCLIDLEDWGALASLELLGSLGSSFHAQRCVSSAVQGEVCFSENGLLSGFTVEATHESIPEGFSEKSTEITATSQIS